MTSLYEDNVILAKDPLEETINKYIHYSILLMSSIALFILCLMNRNQQPLRSRANLPLLGTSCCAVASSFMLLLTLLRHVGALSEMAYAWMYCAAFCITALFGSVILLQAVQIIRFLILQNANFQRLKFIKTSSPRQSFSSEADNTAEVKASNLILKKISTYKLLLSPAIPPILLVVSMVIMVPLHFVGFYLDLTKNDPLKIGILASAVGCYASIYLLIIIVCLADMLKNIRNLCPIHKFFVKKDRLVFRLEAAFGLFAVTYYSLFLGIKGALTSAIAKGGVGVYVVIMILDALKQVCFVIYVGGGIPLAAVFISKLRHWQLSARAWQRSSAKLKQGVTPTTDGIAASDSQTEAMNVMLHDEQGLKLFEEYVQAEYSIENLECWKTIQLLKKASSAALSAVSSSAANEALQQQKKYLTKIYEAFVQTKSPLQVNITNEVRLEYEALVREMQEAEAKRGEQQQQKENTATTQPSSPSSSTSPQAASPLKTITKEPSKPELQLWTPDNKRLLNFESSIMLNLLDSFMRMKQTTEYNHFLKGLETKETMLKEMRFA